MRNPRGVTVAILQARTGSKRLPGKVLMPLEGSPMILRQLERIGRSKSIDQIVVATSEDSSDDLLALTIADAGYDLVRGPLDDVLARFLRVIDEYEPDVVVRLTGDCPLISPAVIDLVVDRFHASSADYVSNTMVPTFPDGLDVEVATSAALRSVARESSDVHEREHVTLGIYRHPERCVIENVVDPVGSDHSELRWTVDDPDDFAFVSSVYRHLLPGNPGFEYRDVLALVATDPTLRRTSADARRNAALDGLDTGAMRHGGG